MFFSAGEKLTVTVGQMSHPATIQLVVTMKSQPRHLFQCKV